MADLTVTAASVARSTGTQIDGIAGATITAGQCVYLDTSVTPNVWKLAQNDGTAAEAGDAGIGIALNGAGANQPIKVQTDGNINPGATVAIGGTYVVSDTAGAIAVVADVTTGGTKYLTILGVGITAALIKLTPIISGVKRA